jgi:hypothetical protein
LEFLPGDVDLCVIGDGFESDVGDALIDEALAHVAAGGHGFWYCARDLAFLDLPSLAVGEEVIWIAGAHDPRAGEGKRHT